MPYITSVEEIGYDRGIKQGKASGFEEGERSLLLGLLDHKFGNLPDSISDRINALPIHKIETLSKALFDFSEIENLLAWLEN